MKNHQYIRYMSTEELAKLLIKEEEVDEGCDHYDEWSPCMMTCYKSPNEKSYMTYEDDLEETVEWLNSDMIFDK